MTTFQDIDLLIKSNKPAEALVLLNRMLAENSTNAEALFLRGKAWWRLGRRDKAMSDYAASAQIVPDGPAAQALEHARCVEDFFNPDLLNP